MPVLEGWSWHGSFVMAHQANEPVLAVSLQHSACTAEWAPTSISEWMCFTQVISVLDHKASLHAQRQQTFLGDTLSFFLTGF